MSNPFIKSTPDGVKYIDSNCSINKLVVAKSPVEGFSHIEGLNSKKIFSTVAIVEYIRNIAKETEYDLGDMYDAELPLFVEQQYLNPDSKFHQQSCQIIKEFGYRLGVILLTLKTGLKENKAAREDWTDENWEYYAELKKIIIVGGLANGEFGRQLKAYAYEIFSKASVTPYEIEMYENASFFGVLGCATKLPKENSVNVLFDFGHTNIKRAIVKMEEGKVKELIKLEHRPSWFVMDDIEDPDQLLEEAKKLHNNLLTVIADTYAIASDSYYISPNINVSIASYIVDGALNKHRGGYAKLTLLAPNYKKLLEKDLRRLLRKKINITLIHDGTAVAYHFCDEKDTVCMSIGTAFGIGFPEMGVCKSDLE